MAFNGLNCFRVFFFRFFAIVIFSKKLSRDTLTFTFPPFLYGYLARVLFVCLKLPNLSKG